MSPVPYIHYHCACHLPPLSKEGDKASGLDSPRLSPAPESIPLPTAPPPSALPPSQLYFCEDCHALRCPSCTQDDVVSYYCPHCLFEVPSASVKGERNRCMRNCFSCPACRTSLTVQAEESVLNSLSGPSSTTVGRYFLACGTCRWDSREVGWSFERPNGLASITRTQDEQKLDVREFDALKAHFEKQLRGTTGLLAPNLASHLRLLNPMVTSPSVVSSASTATPQLNRLTGRIGLSGLMAQEPVDAEYEGPSISAAPPQGSGMRPEEVEEQVVEELMTLTDADHISTQEQRFTQLADQPYLLSQIRPERIHLRAKRSKRCRTCRHILIKPEQKAIATRFKIKLMAIHHVPILTLQRLPTSWRAGQEGSVMILRISNPLYFPIKVTLAPEQAKDKEVPMGHLDLGGLGEFEIPEYSDVWEYDEELYGGGAGRNRKSSGSGHGADAGNQGVGSSGLGIVEERGSSVSVAIRVTPPSEALDDWKIPLLLKYSYIETPEDEDDLLSDEEDDVESGREADASKVSGDADVDLEGKKREEEEGELKEYGFWVTLGLGAVDGPLPMEPSS